MQPTFSRKEHRTATALTKPMGNTHFGFGPGFWAANATLCILCIAAVAAADDIIQGAYGKPHGDDDTFLMLAGTCSSRTTARA